MWGPQQASPVDHVFVVQGDSTVTVEGKAVRATRVDEHERAGGKRTASWWLLLERPYMVYGEVPGADGVGIMLAGGGECSSALVLSTP